METEFKKVLDNCLDILRDNEGLTGEKALRNMSYILTLALIEPRLGNSLNLFDPAEIDLDDIPPNEILIFKRYSVFSNLVNLPEKEQDNLVTLLNFLWNDVLARHPSTKSIFLEGKKFDIQRKTTMVKLVQKIGSLGLNKPDIVEYDLLGAAYERVTASIMTGKVLGQFFTPATLKGVMLDFIQPRVFEDGTCESVCDPTMGTAGFLTKYFRYISDQAKLQSIKLNVKKIVDSGLIYGKEIEPDTFQLAVSNMLISTGHIFKNLERGDSIRDPITHMKFDHVMANPPFGIKGLKYEDFYSPLKNEYVPIKSDNAVSLFIQAIIYMLKIGGKAAVVLPDGQDIFSKTNRTLIAVRELLLKTCDLQEIISVPSGVFENTAIKTCIFCFVKKSEMMEVLSVENSKKSYKYTFQKDTATKEINFSVLDKETQQKSLVTKVLIDAIVDNAYSLNVAEYLEQKVENHLAVGDGVKGLRSGGTKFEVKTLGELFTTEGGKFNSAHMDNNGYIPFYTCKAENPSGYHSVESFDKPQYLLMICGGGSQNNLTGDNVGLGKCYFVKGKTACRSNVFALFPNDVESMSLQYICYYLNIYRYKTTRLAHFTTSLGIISSKDLQKVVISLPPLPIQQQIVEYLDFIYETSIKDSEEKIAQLKRANEYAIKNQIEFGQNEVRTLGEVFDFKSSCHKASFAHNNGKYEFITNSDNRKMDFYDLDDENLFICKVNASKIIFKTKIKYYKGKCSYSSLMYRLIAKTSLNLKFYFYYFNLLKSKIEQYNKGLANKVLDREKFMTLFKIHLPPLPIQQQIVDYCDANQKLIESLEAEIAANKLAAKQYLSTVLGMEIDSQENSQENSHEKSDESESTEEYGSPTKKHKIVHK